ncbi:DNA-binding transcriptional regulator, LysR family [Sinosporangium album]|uniref:DNA-binding transcriptional regulator, LysR family n=1 Tax=Sinosporangium album TaxID=504805 RepID=A0A1G8FGA7_9ACTN|nr:LysR family transcriptional regulator [Sinosporangium album]SDH81150.1 DNA-binding transcriptional regulator, LysR family [Sinosporangium album]
MLDLRRLVLLCEFARRGSIAATATYLGYSASAVSQQLAELEREAGTALLDRTARSAELTDAGRRLVGHAEQILSLVEEAKSDLSSHGNIPSGRVVVTAFPTGAIAFAPILARALRRYEQLTLRMRQGHAQNAIRDVQSGDADIALIDIWDNDAVERNSSTLRFFPLLHDPLVLVLPSDHALAESTNIIDVATLRNENWMAAPAGEPSRIHFDRLIGAVDGEPPDILWEFEGLGALLVLVSEGLGIAVVPGLTLAAGVGGIAVRHLPTSHTGRVVLAVVRRASIKRPAVSVTLKALHGAARELAGEIESVSLAYRY